MSSDEEFGDSSHSNKAARLNQESTPQSPGESVSSLGSTTFSPMKIPDNSSPSVYSRDVVNQNKITNQNKSTNQKNLFTDPGIASASRGDSLYDSLTIDQLLQMQQEITKSIKKKQSVEKQEESKQTSATLADEFEGESKYSESQGSDYLYDGPDFFNKTNELNELNNELDNEINLEEDNQKLDTEINNITKATEKIDDMSVDDLEGLGEDELKKMFNELLQKKEYEELRNIYELQTKKAKNEAMNDKDNLKIQEGNYNKECSQSDNENSQMTTTSCISTATMMEDTIKEIHKNNVIRKIEHKNRQDTVKTILDVRYNKEINFDNIRAAVEEGKSTNEQMSRIWGNYIEGETFKDRHCCYLCGGELVNKDKEFVGLTFNKSLKPEIEHKLPAIEFYGKVHNIINREEYKILFGKWEDFINNPDSNDLLLKVYNSINCNETEVDKMDIALNSLCDIFQEKNEKDDYIDKFICLIKINLIEFAYSHHTCNQVKSNNNLRKSANIYTESIQEYLSNLKNVINKNNINIEDGQQMIGLIKSYKLQHEKNNILGSIENPKNAKRIKGNMRLINSLIDDYTTLCGKTPTRMIAESIRDMKKKITNKTKGKAISVEKKKIQGQIKLTSTQINKIITKFELYINEMNVTKQTEINRKSPRNVNDPKQKFIKLYNDQNIKEKNEQIKKMNEIEPGIYNDFDKYVDYYNNNLKSKFSGVFGGPKSATGGKKSRRLRLKSNRKTKKKGRNSKK